MQPTSNQFWNPAFEIGAKAFCASISLKKMTPLPFPTRLMYGTIAGSLNFALNAAGNQSGYQPNTFYGKLLYSTGCSFISWGIAAKILKIAEKQTPKHFARIPLVAGVSAACAAELGALISRSFQLKEASSSNEALTEDEKRILLELYKRVDA